MLRSRELPYAPLDVARTEEQAVAFMQDIDSGDGKSVFALHPGLSKYILLNTLADMGYKITADKRPFSLEHSEEALRSSLGIFLPDRLHWDSQAPNQISIKVHTATAPYLGLFATPNPNVNVEDVLTEQLREQAKALWQGETDGDMWEEVRQHRGIPGQPVAFRSRGIQPVAHDFQPTQHMPLREVTIDFGVKYL